MRQKTALLICIFLALASITAVVALSSPGSQSDPLVPLSYIDKTYIPYILGEAEKRSESGLNPVFEKYLNSLTAKQPDRLFEADTSSLTSAVLQKLDISKTAKFTDFSLKKGDTVTGKPGTGMIIRSGTAAIVGPANGVLVNLAIGAERSPGYDTLPNIYYMVAADDGTGLKVTSDTGVISLSGTYHIAPAYIIQYLKAAEALKTLKLFKGTSSGFELDRAATRMEALVMLIRLFGKEEAALSFTGKKPVYGCAGMGFKICGLCFHERIHERDFGG